MIICVCEYDCICVYIYICMFGSRSSCDPFLLDFNDALPYQNVIPWHIYIYIYISDIYAYWHKKRKILITQSQLCVYIYI